MAKTLVEMLLSKADSLGDATAFKFHGPADSPNRKLGFAALARWALAVAARLQSHRLQGQPVLVLCPTGPEFICAYFGALCAGAVAVPLPIPSGRRAVARLAAVRGAGVGAAVLTTSEIAQARGFAEALGPQRPPTVCVDRVEAGDALSWRGHDGEPSAPAMLQFTSGSTARPRGVVLSHANLLANLEAIRVAFGHDHTSVFASWLPLFHDMGLVGNVLQPLYCGVPCHLMPPATFLSHPLRWLALISEVRATTSGGPNFGYELCAERAGGAEVPDMDLSSWRVAYNGAEPVRRSTLERFSKAFASHGFDPSSWLPCYGLAEASLLVAAGAPPPTGPVSCGAPAPGFEVLIVGPENGRQCPDGIEGEIWLRGPSVAQGYWNDLAASDAAFGASLYETSEGPYMRTGDFGVLQCGQLTITGRLGDRITYRGENRAPEDLEEAALCADPRLVAAAAFAEPEGARLVIALELSRLAGSVNSHALFVAIRRKLVECEAIAPDVLLLVAYASLPRTTSGKIQRQRCREMFGRGQLRVLASQDYAAEAGTVPSPDSTDIELLVQLAACCARLEPRDVDPDLPLPLLGLDSIGLMRLRDLIHSHRGWALPFDLFWASSCRSLASHLSDVPAAETHPLPDPLQPTPAQQGFWLHSILQPDDLAPRLARAFTLPPDVNVAALVEALRRVWDRHPALRMRFDASASRLRLAPVDPEAAWLKVVDTHGNLAASIEAASAAPLNLTRGPLFRAVLLLADPAPAVLLLLAHHAVCDLGSLFVVLADLDIAYGTRNGRGAFPDELLLPSVPAPSSTARLDALRRYWDAALTEDAQLDLGTLSAAALPSIKAERQDFNIDSSTVASLHRLTTEHQVTQFTVLAAAVLSVLRDMSGSYAPGVSVAVAEPATGVGDRVRLVTLQVPLHGLSTLGEVLRATGDRLAGALSHADAPSALIAHKGRPRDGLDREPEVLLLYAGSACSPFEAATALGRNGPASGGKLKLTPLSMRPWGWPAALTLSVAGSAAGLHLVVGTRSDRYSPEMAERVAHWLQARLKAYARGEIAPDYTRPAQNHRAETAEPRHPVLAFEEQASCRPEATAVEADGQHVSYAQLAAQARRLAALLRAGGAGPETLVGLAVTPGFGLPVALLGILGAGASYLPLIVEQPLERLRELVRQASPDVILTESGIWPENVGIDVPMLHIDVADDWPDITPMQPAPASALAYVISTSGSTGAPKLIEVECRQLTYALSALAERLGVRPGDRIAATTSLAFDIAANELLLPLCHGATIVFVDPASRIDPIALADAIARVRPDVVQATPTILRLLVDAGWAGHRGLRVWSGGEALESRLARALLLRTDELWNLYGPTEATVFASATQVVHADLLEQPTAPIHDALRGTELRIDDITSELTIVGPGVARGYRGAPAATARAFVVACPPGSIARAYRSGDRVERLANGRLVFVGRVDRQIKRAGVRVELDEIEAELRRLDPVREAAVVACGSAARLAVHAYVAGPAPIDIATLGAALRKVLPASHWPTHLVALAAMPRTPGGKLDRRALPKPTDVVAPASPPALVEEGLVELVQSTWCRVLGHKHVDPDRNFFDLGGHSLHMIQVQLALLEQLERPVPLVELFRNPTVRTLAQHLGFGPAETPPPDGRSARRAGNERLAARRMAIRRTSQ